jgi:hypothetical protein
MSGYAFSSPAIAADGTIYVGGGTNLYAIRSTNSLVNSPWPMFRRDRQHSARTLPWGIGNTSLSPEGMFGMWVSLPVEATNLLECSSDLVRWSVLTNIVATNSPIPIIDATAQGFRERYYRLVVP